MPTHLHLFRGSGSVPLLPCLHLLHDQKADEANGNNEDDAEDDNDTGLMTSPVAPALGKVRDSAGEGDCVGLDGRHFEGGVEKAFV